MKQFTVEITPKGSTAAYPSIWYGGKVGQRFEVEKSKQFISFYEVGEGKFKGKVIDPKDCIKIN